jgi:hypothetical protein
MAMIARPSAKIPTASGSGVALKKRNNRHGPSPTAASEIHSARRNASAEPILPSSRHCERIFEVLSVMWITDPTVLSRISPGKVKCDAFADKLITFARCLN